MSGAAAERALAWRKLEPSERARALLRWCERLVAASEPLSQRVSECIVIDAADALHYDVVALAAALDELASVAPSVLRPALSRRWLGGEPIARRIAAPERVSIAIPARTMLAPPLAWCATALVCGASVTLHVAPEAQPAVRALLDRARPEDAMPIEVLDSMPEALGAALDDPPAPLRASALRAPSLAWIDDVSSVARAIPTLVRAARYTGGEQRGALRWVAAKPAVVDALFDALGAHERDGVRWTREPSDEAFERRPMTVSVEAFADEQSFVARALETRSWAAACAFATDRRRAQSIALRTGADAVYIDSSPADSLGGAMRADFDAHRWLAHAARVVPIVEGPTGALARVEGRTPLRMRWLRAWLRLQLGRYGLGGSVEDLW